MIRHSSEDERGPRQGALKCIRAQTPRSSGATDGGEEFYFAAEQRLGSPLFAIAKALHDGQLSEPVAAGGHVHVLATHSNRQPVAQGYSAARDQVLPSYRTDKIARMRAGTDRFLRERADLQIARDLQ